MTAETETATPRRGDTADTSFEDYFEEGLAWATLALQKHGLDEIVDPGHVASAYGEFTYGFLYLLYPEDEDLILTAYHWLLTVKRKPRCSPRRSNERLAHIVWL